MTFNKYDVYSVISTTKKNEDNLKDILEKIEHFNEIEKIDEAKKYLEDTWHLNSYIKNYSIGCGCVINIDENSTQFKVNFEYDKNSITHFYTK